MPTIELSGPDGNAYFLIGSFIKVAKQIGMSKEQIDRVINDMESNDYDHLLKVFHRELGCIITLEKSGKPIF